MALLTKTWVRNVGRASAAQASLSVNQRLRQLSEVQDTKEAFDIFLCHSYLDAELVLGLKSIIEDLEHSVYVDWVVDGQLDRSSVSRATAELLRERMAKSMTLFFATSSTSACSKWMPWECGYFDGLKGKVAVCPLVDEPGPSNEFQGQEYLSLYPYVTHWVRDGDAIPQLWIHESPSKCVNFRGWIKGGTPHEH